MPGISFCPLSALSVVPKFFVCGPRPAASTYAVVKEDWALAATASVLWIVPCTIPGPPPVQGAGSPVHDVPGLTPRSPVTTVGPVLVTAVPASTAKGSAVPRDTGLGEEKLAAC